MMDLMNEGEDTSLITFKTGFINLLNAEVDDDNEDEADDEEEEEEKYEKRDRERKESEDRNDKTEKGYKDGDNIRRGASLHRREVYRTTKASTGAKPLRLVVSEEFGTSRQKPGGSGAAEGTTGSGSTTFTNATGEGHTSDELSPGGLGVVSGSTSFGFAQSGKRERREGTSRRKTSTMKKMSPREEDENELQNIEAIGNFPEFSSNSEENLIRLKAWLKIPAYVPQTLFLLVFGTLQNSEKRTV